ncbi:MAG: hypothetical protein M3O70_01905 [Actinomycetota bacterium]|nr:hypothetical protein [Actinomycetota bacterium]
MTTTTTTPDQLRPGDIAGLTGPLVVAVIREVAVEGGQVRIEATLWRRADDSVEVVADEEAAG